MGELAPLGARLMTGATVAVVPFSADYLDNRLFASGGPLDRDESLRPFRSLRDHLQQAGVELATVDRVGPRPAAWLHLDAHGPLPRSADHARSVVVVMEPEVVAPYWYDVVRGGEHDVASLWMLSSEFADGIRTHRLHYPHTLGPADRNIDRDLTLVMINARKRPVRRVNELYTSRERVAAELAASGDIAVFGAGWGRQKLGSVPAMLRSHRIGKAARGVVGSKREVMRRARFCLCFENSIHPGYRTEKLLDALQFGSIPIYWGDPEVPDELGGAVVDYRELGSATAVRRLVKSMSTADQQRLREAGWDYLASPAARVHSIATFCHSIGSAIESVIAS